jgi:hypothetical protein
MGVPHRLPTTQKLTQNSVWHAAGKTQRSGVLARRPDG